MQREYIDEPKHGETLVSADEYMYICIYLPYLKEKSIALIGLNVSQHSMLSSL